MFFIVFRHRLDRLPSYYVTLGMKTITKYILITIHVHIEDYLVQMYGIGINKFWNFAFGFKNFAKLLKRVSCYPRFVSD